MKKLLILVLSLVTSIWVQAKDRDPAPASTTLFRGEEIPVYASPHLIMPKKMGAPMYPATERTKAADGKAVLAILVDPDGKVAEVEVISSEPTPAFGASARAATLKWKYEPLKWNGHVTRFIVRMPILFRSVEESSTEMAGPR